MSSLDIVLQLLRIAPGTRSAEELKRLKLLTSNIKFFQKLTEEHGNDICHTRLCSRMTLRSYEAGQYIFNFNDPGDFFCVILKGKVSVQVPENTNVNSLRRNTLINLRPEKRPSTFVVVASPDADAATERSAEHNELAEDLKVELPRRKNTIILNEVATLEAGSVFGELSLISGQPRVASVQCKDPTYCAVLSRQDYQELLGAYEQQKLNEKIAVLASLPLFKGWTQSYLKKQHFYFTEVTFHRHQTVFQQGRPANYLYIIKEGEFKTYMHQPIDSSRSSNLITRAQRVYKRLELVIKGAGELLADEELVREIDHTCSCECISQSGTLIMIKQSDMRFRVNHPETWKYLKSKYETEGKWLSGRVNMLENPTVTWEEPPAVSVDLTPTRRRKSVVKPKSTDITFDKALVHAPRPQTRSSSSVYSDLVLKKLRDASVKPLMPKMRSYTPAVHRRLPAKPPPNFFVKAKAAVSQKYKNRRKIL
eukprot:CAMPEP_0204897990 /NCGR_PEP_ID=MMETSP1397-20131031/1033_1 /ASSEMBLY_ACC=CAM_ASM_000891 /TAXON_ID=49980 /ORGANISM="Climacostomum Climacostomum virens, Strain Stock W-24" /LENGTH=479 /DNA_ID=CAMNT_0052065777 /DNA_START=438 /DNA_END=1873 /DNA_ORIENTATION=+